MILADAEEDGLILANPAAGLKNQGAPGKKRRSLDSGELEALLTAAPTLLEPRSAVLILALADAGLPGEACELRWEDADMTARTLHVGHATTQLTPSTYAHQVGGSDRRWMAKLETRRAALGPVLAPETPTATPDDLEAPGVWWAVKDSNLGPAD